STLDDNSTGDGGNAVFNGGTGGHGGAIANSGTATVSNSTLSGNMTGNVGCGSITCGPVGFGGADYNPSNTIPLLNSPLDGNHYSAGGTFGSTIANNSTLTIKNTIIAHSTDAHYCEGAALSANSTTNLNDETVNSCGSSFAANARLNLGSLADNGGPTQ